MATSLEIDLKDLLKSIFKYRYHIAFVFLMGQLISIAVYLKKDEKFMSQSFFIIKQPGNQKANAIANLIGVSSNTSEANISQYYDKLIFSDEFLLKFLQRAVDESNPKITFRSIYEKEVIKNDKKSLDEYEMFRKVVDHITGNKLIIIDRDNLSGVYNLKTFSDSADLALKINQCILEILNTHLQNEIKSAENLNLKFIGRRIAEIKFQLDSLESEVVQFEQNNKSITSPKIQLAYKKLQRNLNIQQTIYIQLVQSFETSKMEIQREAMFINTIRNPTLSLEIEPKGWWKIWILVNGILFIFLIITRIIINPFLKISYKN